MVKSFSIKFVIDTTSGLASIAIPKALEQFVGIDNLAPMISKSIPPVFDSRTTDGKLRNTIKLTNEAFRTCCGCEEKTFHDHNDECIICGRTNIR